MARAAVSATGCGAASYTRHDSARLPADVRRRAAGRDLQLPRPQRADIWSRHLIQREPASRPGLVVRCRLAAEELTGNRRASAPAGTEPERPS